MLEFMVLFDVEFEVEFIGLFDELPVLFIDEFDVEFIVEFEVELPVVVVVEFVVEFIVEFVVVFVLFAVLPLLELPVSEVQAAPIAATANKADKAKVFFIEIKFSCLLKDLLFLMSTTDLGDRFPPVLVWEHWTI
jgi:hypothetical protein